jgi:spore coat polysaccharide biosynthesis protein SpsF (cytidylyltransferase family)
MSTSYTLEELNAMLALNEDTEISEVTSAEYLETNASDEFVYRVMHMSTHKGTVVENRLFVETNEDGDLVAVVYDHGDDDPDQTEVDLEEAMETHPDAVNSEFPLTSSRAGR